MRFDTTIMILDPNLNITISSYTRLTKKTKPCPKTLLSHPVPCHEFNKHFSGRNAHHSGCKLIAFTPRAFNRYLTSCIRAKASLTSRLPSARVPPVQNNSAEAAARGQAMLSRFSGPDCSVQSSCSPPSTSGFWASVRFAKGSKE